MWRLTLITEWFLKRRSNTLLSVFLLSATHWVSPSENIMRHLDGAAVTDGDASSQQLVQEDLTLSETFSDPAAARVSNERLTFSINILMLFQRFFRWSICCLSTVVRSELKKADLSVIIKIWYLNNSLIDTLISRDSLMKWVSDPNSSFGRIELITYIGCVY